MTKERYKKLIGEDTDEAQFWIELGIFLAHAKSPDGSWTWKTRAACYLGDWIVQGAGEGGRELGRCIDNQAKGRKDYNFRLQCQQLAQSAISHIVECFKGQDEDGYLRQWRLREGYQRRAGE